MKKKITKIEVQVKNKERVNVFLDGEYSFAIDMELVYKESLSVGKVIDDEDIKSILEKDENIKCKNAGIRIIERSYKTEKELRDRLLEKGYNEFSVENTIDFLKKYNFINDRNYATAYIKDKIKTKGIRSIKYMLTFKGISEDIIEEAISNVSKDDEEESAKKIALKKYNIIIKSETDKYKIKNKLYRFLVSRGYDYEMINRIINEVMEGGNFLDYM